MKIMKEFFGRLLTLFKTNAMYRSIARHLITVIGGLLVARGIITESTFIEISGILLGIAGIFLSITGASKLEIGQRIQGVLRHLLTFLAGIGIMKGYVNSNEILSAVSEILTALVLVWSGSEKMKNQE